MRELDDLSSRFWAWRGRQQPRSRDDIPRLDRPAGWLPEISPSSLDRHRSELAGFAAELAALHPSDVADRVDHRLLRSAMARVTWENDVLQVHRLPRFWIDQAIGPVFDTLLRPGIDAGRIAEVVRFLRAVPLTLSHAPSPSVSPAPPEHADGTNGPGSRGADGTNGSGSRGAVGAIGTAGNPAPAPVPPPVSIPAAAATPQRADCAIEPPRACLDAGAPPREFAELALGELDAIGERVAACVEALARVHPPAAAELRAAAAEAGAALAAYAAGLAAALPGLPSTVPIGRERYEWFLREVACVPLGVSEIAAIGRREYDRAVWLELLHANRNRDVPQPPLPDSAASQVRTEARAELEVRAFYEAKGLLSQPDTLRRYLNLPMPDYLEPLRFLGVTDDLTGPARLTEDGVSYVPAPSPDLPYFYRANAQDPRAGIIHEGVHYQQLALSWRNPRPVRRHYYDSGANEGIAFYNEEMMLVSGLLDAAPHTRTVVCNFMRLRALRVTVDVGLATGELSIADVGRDLAERVPMDKGTAMEEAAFFAETPGQALTYQIGKTQLISLLADASRVRGKNLDLRKLHDAIWLNGNVPIALLRWELLGLTDELPAIGV